ncbi:uncharacterized protein si:cabz01007794.1 isoform X3 [Oryzias latipes]
MDKYRLLLSILFVTLSWGCMRTSAQNNPNATATGGNATAPGENATAPGGNATAPGGNATAPGGNATSPGGNATAPGGNATAPGGNATAPGGNATAPGGNATAPGGNATAPGGNATAPGGNATSPGGNATAPGGNATAPGGNATSPGGNATAPGGNATAPGGNATAPGGNATAPGGNATSPGGNPTAPGGNNPTSPPIISQAPPLSPNTSVEALPTNLSRSECGKSQLCAAEPSTCDPTTDSSCFFLGAQKKGDNFEFSLSGQSDGYVAASVLIPTIGKEVVYICANDNNKVKFFGAILENNQLKLTNLSVNSVKGKVRGRTIQCTFGATVPDPRVPASNRARRAADVTLSVSTGPYNANSDSLGTPTPTIRATVPDLANSNTTVVNDISNSTNTSTPQGNSTTSTGNSTTSTGNSTTSTGNSTTQAPALSPNTSVEALPTNLSRSECGKTQLCAAEPSTCDPTTDSSCFFLGAKKNGDNFEFSLSGQSDGYVAASVLIPLIGKEVVYVCANNNNKVKFIGAILESNQLKLTTLSVNSVKGKVRGRTIQCTFLATVPDPLVLASKRARRATDVTVSVLTGSYNTSSDDLGTPTPTIRATVSDLANSNTTVVNQINNSTTPAPGGNSTTQAGNTVGSLQTDISNTGCRSDKLCAAAPSSCNPSAGGTCSFLSAKQKSGQIYSFELSGLSDGYMASALSTTSTTNNGSLAYVCANNNGAVKFITAVLNNDNTLTEKTQNVISGSVKGKISGRQIQCIFEATLPDTSVRAAVFSMLVVNGTYNSSSNAFGSASILVRTNVVNLSDPTANITNLVTSGVAPHYHPLMQALLVTFGILVLTILGH